MRRFSIGETNEFLTRCTTARTAAKAATAAKTNAKASTTVVKIPLSRPQSAVIVTVIAQVHTVAGAK